MRWLYLLAAVLALLLTLPAPLSQANPVTIALTMAAMVTFVVSWTIGYRLRRSSIWLDIADAVALTAFALACPEPAVTFSIAFSGLWYRSLYGSVARAALTCAVYAVGMFAVLPLWNLVPNGHLAPASAAIIGPIPAMFLVGIVGRMLGSSLFVREESAHRDATLAAAGAALLGARDPAEILVLAHSASDAICAATPGLRSIAVMPDRYGATVAFTTGTFVQQPTIMPNDTVERAADDGAWTVRDWHFLDALVGAACAWVVIPPPTGTAAGYVLLGAQKQVPNEAVLAMTSLLNQVILAIRNCQDRQRLTVQARTDALTGLANRAAFAEALTQVGEPITVLFIDLDNFKKVNDGLGHAAGDELLQKIAERLTAAAGRDAVAARLGGDEFALMVTGRSADEVDLLASVVVASIREPVRVAGTDAYVGASVGIAATIGFATDPELLLRQADQAMYAAKLAGKNQVRRYESLDLQSLAPAS